MGTVHSWACPLTDRLDLHSVQPRRLCFMGHGRRAGYNRTGTVSYTEKALVCRYVDGMAHMDIFIHRREWRLVSCLRHEHSFFDYPALDLLHRLLPGCYRSRYLHTHPY